MQMQRAILSVAGVLAVVACDKSEAEATREPVAEELAAEELAVAEPAPEPAEPPATPEPPPIPGGAKIFFVEPQVGEVKGPEKDGKVAISVKMGAEGIVVEPAGAQKEGSGHHHILVDTEALPSGTVVPKDETHLHFGQGQTEAEVLLPPGKHTLTLQFADGLHLSYGPELSSSLEIDVVPEPK